MIHNDRLTHSLAVARKMIEIGKTYNLKDDELKDLFILGFNHDIGYEYGNNSNHAHIGGEILNKADMQIDKYGNDVGYTKRLEDIKSRYGENSITYKNAEILVSKLRSEN